MNHRSGIRLLLQFVATKAAYTYGFLLRTTTPTLFGVARPPQPIGRNAPVALDMKTTDSTSAAINVDSATIHASSLSDHVAPHAVQAPLKYLGPYPALSLRFPNLATPSQKKRNVTGISLDFVLDTAANINTLNGQVAKALDLPVVGKALPGVGTSGPLAGGDNTYFLGDCQLENGLILWKDKKNETNESFLFMTNLTASALPVVNPAAAGLLGSAFLQCFTGGVEFVWGKKVQDDNGTIVAEYPSITFYSELPPHLDTMQRVKVTPLPITLLPSITVKLNGIEMTALLDTGSPITVLNQQAARAIGVELAVGNSNISNEKRSGVNPLARMAENANLARAASSGDVLTIAGGRGQMVHLYKSKHGLPISVASSKGDVDVNFGDSSFVYVGDLPGLAALNGLGENAPPAVVLGMDVLRQRQRMVFCGQQNELYF